MTYIIIFIILKLISWVGLSKIFEKAGVPAWKAFVPFLNWSEWLKLIGKPQWWIILLFIPVVNIFYGAYMLIGLSKSFKHYDFWHHAAAVLGFFAYLPFLGFSKDEKYFGIDGLRENEHLPEIGFVRGGADSIIFAIVAAHLIRMFFIEAYKIPTSSMEPTLQIGDFMFVSKANYGSRIPNTPLSLPLIHHTVPKTKARAYSELIELDYYRLPGIEKIERNDIAVFNVPFEHNMQSEMSKSYANPKGVKYKSRPVDKRENYIKRIVGAPGDKLQITNNVVTINDAPAETPELAQFHYLAVTNKEVSIDQWRELGIRAYNNYLYSPPQSNPAAISNTQYRIDATPAMIANLKSNPIIDTIVAYDYTNSAQSYPAGFPVDSEEKGWTIQDYGPIVIPAKGLTITLTDDNFETYKEAIAVHEHNDLKRTNGVITINGIETNEYTFKMDYFFMMGDNRHSSLDSRAWGFVPEDHIVGKPLFIFFSQQSGPGNEGIRWNRLLKPAQDMN